MPRSELEIKIHNIIELYNLAFKKFSGGTLAMGFSEYTKCPNFCKLVKLHCHLYVEMDIPSVAFYYYLN